MYQKRILIIDSMPDKSGAVLTGGTGVEMVKLLNEVGLDAKADCEFRTILPTFNYQGDNLVKLNKTAKDAYEVNGSYVHKNLVGSIGKFLKSLPEDPDRLIFGLGAIPLLAFTGETSIKNYRGSMFPTRWGKFIATYHPKQFIKMWEWRYVSRSDYRRGLQYRDAPFPEPEYDFTIDPNFEQTVDWLAELRGSLDTIEASRNDGVHKPLHVSCDIETFRRSQISVCGLAVSERRAISIPFIDFTTTDYSRWTCEQESTIISLLRDILTHPSAEISGQNYHYDSIYFARYWGFKSRHDLDPMHMFHCLLPGELEKSLGFLSSIFCRYHMYWKDEGKEIHDAVKTADDQIQYWRYNAKDCVTTWEISENIRKALEGQDLTHVWDFQRSMSPIILKPMLRGVNYDAEKQLDWRFQYGELQRHYEAFFERMVPSVEYFPRAAKKSSPWYRSPTKTKTLLYDILGLEVQYNKKTKKPSTDDASLKKLIKKEAALKPLLTKLLEYRSLGVFVSNFLSCKVDTSTKRMHTFYNLSGAETFRLSSRQDVFDTGANLQNTPKGGEKK